MILVLEPDPDRAGRVSARIVLQEDEKEPDSLIDLRLMMERAIRDLPGRIGFVPIKRFADRKK